MIGIETNGPDAWANGVSGEQSNFDNYIAGFYWAVMTTTTIGRRKINCDTKFVPYRSL
jgi:hypothetical protein